MSQSKPNSTLRLPFVGTTHNPKVQVSPNGMLTDAFVARYQAVRARHKLAIWQIAQAAKWSYGFLGNATRFPGDTPGSKLNVSMAFANRLAAIVESLETAQTDDEVKTVLEFFGTKAAAASAVTHSLQRDEAEEDDEPTLEFALAILRRHGITSVSLQTTS
jgi:hypothetical protein